MLSLLKILPPPAGGGFFNVLLWIAVCLFAQNPFSFSPLLFFSYILHLSHRKHFLLLPSSATYAPPFFYIFYSMMPGSKGLNPHELAHRWMKDLGTRPDMSIKVG